MKKGSTQSTLLTYLLLSGIAALVSSCQDYEPYSDQHVKDVAYTHEFERQFGDIDPNQNWDLFGQLARRRYAVTRADQYVNQVSITDSPSSDYIRISKEEAQEYQKVLPESPVWGANLTDVGMTNLGRVKQDFVASDHTFTLAPVYWITGGNQDEIGIYWYTDDEKNADVTIMGSDGELYWLVRKKLLDGKSRLQYYGYNANNWGQPSGSLALRNIPTSLIDAGDVFNFPRSAQYLESHPISVTIPEEIPVFGFYLTNNQGTRYSESKLNKRISKNGWDNVSPCYVATFNIQKDIDATSSDNRDYLCFEDNFDDNETDFDLNDLVFAIGGLDENSIIDRTTVNENAILVCEDLQEFDFDFNDIALEVNYTEEINRAYKFVSSGEGTGHYVLDEDNTTETQTLKVTAMAAGGASESTVTLNNQEWGEIHALMNETPELPVGSKNHKIINASSVYTDLKGQSLTFTKDQLPPKNVGTGEGQYPTYLSQLFDTDGFFAITTTDGTATKIISNKSFKGKGEGNTAPQMMLLPDYFEWPLEQTYIKDAYAKFTDWVEDVTKTDWILNSQEAALVTDRGNLEPTINPDTPSEVKESFELKPTTGTFSFTGSNGRTVTYYNGIFLPLPAELQDEAYDNASAKLHITFPNKLNRTYYLDDAAGQEILKDNTGTSGSNVYNKYTISATRLKQALTAVSSDGKVGIWIVTDGDREVATEGELQAGTFKAEIDILNVTTEAHHKLFVNPTYIVFESSTPQQITAHSSTGGDDIITFTSSDNSVVTVSKTGLVTPVADGYASIVVRAEASTVNGKAYKATSERVSVEVIMGSDSQVILKLGTTQKIAGATGDLTNYALCTTVRTDLSPWTNGATLTVTNTAGDEPYFELRTAGDDVVVEKQKVTNKQITYQLSATQLAQFKNSAGDGYTFKVVHSEDTYVQAAILDKR